MLRGFLLVSLIAVTPLQNLFVGLKPCDVTGLRERIVAKGAMRLDTLASFGQRRERPRPSARCASRPCYARYVEDHT
jgi:hypothetical protein